MTDYNDGKWHRWAGEDMKPASVHPKSKIEYIWLSDTSNSGRRTRVAGADEDESSPAWRQILAFRVIEEHREPREWWALWSPSGTLIGNFTECGAHEKNDDYYGGRGEIIHIREVIE